MILDAAYWITIAHLPRWNHFKINSLIVKIFSDKKTSFADFFATDPVHWKKEYELTEDQIGDLVMAKKELANNSFLAESLKNQGYELIPITSPNYSPILKKNLKLKYAPPVLYVKGNTNLLLEKTLAIVGARNASDAALLFTDRVAKNATENYQVVVSGFAKGVDKEALDSAIKYKGQSIIVLPQGILTFGTGFRKYYKQIIDGDVLVLSTFHPKVPWRAELAMARNPIIYGLAEDIYVAESSDKGGTWSGVLDGLKKGRTIYIRKPDAKEDNANIKLIEAGAIPVDNSGKLIEPEAIIAVKEDAAGYTQGHLEEILALLADNNYTAKELCAKLNNGWAPQKMASYLKSIDEIEMIKCGNVNKYGRKDKADCLQTSIWD